MSNQKIAYPYTQRQADVPVSRAQMSFYGMFSGNPASEIDVNHSALNINVIDHGGWASIRPGTRQATGAIYGNKILSVNATTDTITFTFDHPWKTGEPIWIKTSDTAPAGLETDTEYFCIYVSSTELKVATTYANAIAGTAIDLTAVAGVGDTHVYYGEINACIEHESRKEFVFLLGNRIYVSDTNFSSFKSAYLIGADYPTGLGMMDVQDQDVILACTNGLFRIVLSDEYHTVEKINEPVPNDIITDASEDVDAGLIYGYHVIYSHARLSKGGAYNRITDDTAIINESGASNPDDFEKDYGEVFFADAVGPDVDHVYNGLTAPDGVYNITHFPLYRTKNIGKSSGGVSETVDGMGNSTELYAWVEDVPVAKTYVFGQVGANKTLTISAGVNALSVGDAYNQIILLNYLDGTEVTRTIESVDVTAGTITVTGSALTGQYMGYLGGGRRLVCSQYGKTVTINLPLAGGFVPGDVGKLLFKSDGTYTIVTDYISATQVKVIDSANYSLYACSIAPLSGNFTRSYCDRIPDSSIGIGMTSLDDRILSKSDLYFPKRFYKPIPHGDTIVINNGFAIVAARDGGKYDYSGFGDKGYTMGYHNVIYQTAKIEGKISHMVKMPDICIILCSRKTLVVSTSVSNDVGRADVGEYTPTLQKATVVDMHIGVTAWQSIAFKTSSLFIAMTSEPAIRMFDGHSWSPTNFAVDQNGNDMIQKYYLDRIDPTYGVMAEYTRQGGYVLWAYRWIYQ